MKRIYVAGPYSSDNIIDTLDYMREGQRMATRVLLAGFAPWCPWIDFHYQLQLRDDEELTVDNYYEYSITWLVVSDAMLVMPGWQYSKGTLKEIEIARALGIPIYYSFDDMVKNEK